MKKILLLVLTVALILTMCACGGKEEKEETSSLPSISAVESTTPTPTPEPEDVKVVIAGQGVNVRAEPNTDCEIYGQAVFDAFYLIEEDDGTGFHKIDYKGQEAYIYAEYCEIQTLTESAAKSLVEGVAVSGDDTTSDTESEPESTVSINAEDGQRR